MSLDISDYNARWLKAWSDKDVTALVAFYAEDAVYRDPQVPDGLQGRKALAAYLEKLFSETPPMRYDPHEIWPTHNGYCGRWYCEMSLPDGKKSYLRGFDLVVLSGEHIALNEVYVHSVAKRPES